MSGRFVSLAKETRQRLPRVAVSCESILGTWYAFPIVPRIRTHMGPTEEESILQNRQQYIKIMVEDVYFRSTDGRRAGVIRGAIGLVYLYLDILSLGS